MGKRESGWDNQPRRISRRARKTLQNVFRRYLGNTRQEVRYYVQLMCEQNLQIPVKNRKRIHRFTNSVMPCDDYMAEHVGTPKYLVIHVHGNHFVSEKA